MPALSRNPRLVCAYHALQMSLFPMAVITLFWQYQIGMSMTQILMLQGFFGFAMALFEFPSGYLADRIGYRRTLILAALMMAVGWSIYLVSHSFGAILGAEFVLGVAMSLISGSDSALLYESLVETEQEARFGHWAGLQRFWGQFGEGTAALTAGLLYAWWDRAPFALEILVWLANLLIALRMVEPERHRPPTEDNWKQIKGMFRHAVLDNHALRAVFFITIVLSMSSFVPVWMIQIYAQESGVPTWALGPIWATANYTVAIFSLLSARCELRFGLLRLVLICCALTFAGYAGLGLTETLWSFAFYFLITASRGLFAPALHHQEQRLIPSQDRAGFLSLRSLVFRLSFLALAPVIGVLVDDHGQHSVLTGLAVAFPLAILVGWMFLRRHVGEAEAA